MPATDAPGIYIASRMSYRGQGGWLDLRIGPLARLARKYIRLLGTDDLFEELRQAISFTCGQRRLAEKFVGESDRPG